MENKPLIINHKRLSNEALTNIVKDVFLRERGNDDWGDDIIEDKVQRTVRSIHNKSHFVIYDPKSDSVTVKDAASLQPYLK